LELAKMNKLDEVFMNWLKTENHFCNSLVDRIVPGKLPEQDKISMEQKLGYSDELMIMAESFRLWVLESEDERVKNILSFSHADEGMLITPDIGKFRELKLRLLNGTHSFVCGLAYLAGFKTVKEAMEDHLISSVVQNLMMNEIAVAMADDSIPYQDACNFAAKVMDRFRNPYIDHRWMSISIQYSLKMKMRNIPLLIKHYSKTAEAPELMALGFAAFLLFMKSNVNSNGQYFGRVNDSEYWVQDEYAGYFAEKWKTSDGNYVVDSVLADKNFWDAELDKLNGFSDLVKSYIDSLQQNGVMQTIRGLQLQKTEV
ncbi:MAG TPA: altronate oxidoreductase, partial [Chitinophagaceae bacterium]|nr:altronate oxidoreductase [Chitinophagaceae bacterium]